MRDASNKVDFLVDIMRDKHEGETIMREIIKTLALRARTPRTSVSCHVFFWKHRSDLSHSHLVSFLVITSK